MQSINASSYSYNDFNFSMKTSSGDTIDLKMYDERSAEFSDEQTDTTRTTTLSLSHAYGYAFKYEGNGIDEQDKKEIEAAMKLVSPMMEEYLANIKETQPSNAELINKAFDINSYLPKPEEANTKNYFNDKTLKAIDKILEKTENQNEKMLKNAQKLFDALLKQSERFELYM
jgi:hypothetical protein